MEVIIPVPKDENVDIMVSRSTYRSMEKELEGIENTQDIFDILYSYGINIDIKE